METVFRNLDTKGIINALQQQSLLKRDFVVPSTALVYDGEGDLTLNLPSLGNDMTDLLKSLNITTPNQTIYRTEPNSLCHEHFSEKLKISKNYYDRMLDGHKSLLASNINYWLRNDRKNYLLRTFVDPNGNGGIARALLSDSYKPIDNWDVAITILDVVRNHPTIQLDAADITDRKMYMRFVDPTIEHNAPELLKKYKGGNNDGIVAGFIVSNSEVGEGAFSISPRAVILACNNGLTRIDERMRKVHLGGKMEQGHIQWSDQTQRKNMELIQCQSKDAIEQWLTKDYLKGVTNWLLDIQQIPLEYPIDCTKNICAELKITDERVEKILNHFITDGDVSPVGIAQAITNAVQDFSNADEQYEVESKVYALIENVDKFDKKTKK